MEAPKRSSWLDALTEPAGIGGLTPEARQTLARLDDVLFAAWNLDDNLVLAWTREAGELRFLLVRHYAIIDRIERETMNAILAYPGCQRTMPDGFDKEKGRSPLIFLELRPLMDCFGLLFGAGTGTTNSALPRVNV